MMQPMGSIELRYLSVETNRHGRRVYYVRKGGRRIRLPDAEDPGFMAAYHTALGSKPPPPMAPDRAKADTLGWLISLYLGSATFERLAPATRAARRRILDRICKKGGKEPVKAITAKVITASRDARQGPEAANSFLKTMSAVFTWAVEAGHAAENPVLGVKRIRTATTGHEPWTEEDIATYRARHPLGTRARLMLEILTGTGLRISDVAVIGRQHMRGGEINIRTQKTKVTVTLPIAPELSAALEVMPPETRQSASLTLLRTESGAAFTVKGLGQWFRDRCDEAGISKSAHGLRKYAATALADLGASEHQLMAVFGWKDPKEAAVYTREANRKRLARQAFDLKNGQSQNAECRTLDNGATKTGNS